MREWFVQIRLFRQRLGFVLVGKRPVPVPVYVQYGQRAPHRPIAMKRH